MKTCTKCKIERNDEEFTFRSKTKNIQHTICVYCMREMSRLNYLDKVGSYKVIGLTLYSQIVNYIKKVKSESKCEKCGENHPACLDFHHIRDKKFQISQARYKATSLQETVEEINKCIILCANCHRKHHYENK